MAVGFEMFLGATEISMPSFVDYYKEVGRTFKPNTDIIAFNEGFYLGKSNEYGYLGPAYPPEKPDSVVRIVLIGDSFVEGMQLFERMHFRSILENELRKLFGDKVQVLNFGRAGSDLRSEFVYLKNFAYKFDPDYVLFFIGASSFYRIDKNPNPLPVISGDSLIIDSSYWYSKEMQERRRYSFLRNLPSFALIKKSIKLIKSGKVMPLIFGKFYDLFAGNPDDEKSGQEMIFGEKKEDKYSEINIRIIEELGRMNNDKKILVVLRDKIPGKYLSKIKSEGLRTVGLNDYLDNLKRKGFDPTFWETTKTHGHWNAEAHKLIGNYLAKILKQEL